MTDINRVILVGRLTRDAELRYTTAGTGILSFSIATSKSILRDQKWQDEVYFFDCVLFGKKAESLVNYLGKGKQIGIDGELQQKRWTDKTTQQARSKVNIYVNLLQFLSSKSGGTSFDKQDSGQDLPPENKSGEFDNPQEFDDDGIPF
jgi:single-strand DNA-binding protein